MSFVRQPPTDLLGREPLAEDPDQLLRAFFRAELPDPWPVWQPPAEPVALSRPRRPRRRSLARSRFALAASLLLLLSGPLALTRVFSDLASSGTTSSPGLLTGDRSRQFHPAARRGQGQPRSTPRPRDGGLISERH